MLRNRNRQNETELLTITIIKLIMESNSFKPGSVVMMKSGSPKMTVTYSDETTTVVKYYNYETHGVSPSIEIATLALELYVP